MTELGEMLRTARQKRSLSLDLVAEATRIKITYLDALENGDYSLLPGPAYVTGFIRNYARYLGLHPDDLVQVYHASRPIVQPEVKAATRVLASGYERQNRTRLLWALAALVVLLVGGYAVKQYAQNGDAHAYAPLNVTPANLGSPVSTTNKKVHAATVRVRLQAIAPVWVHVIVDGKNGFKGILRPGHNGRLWVARHSVYMITYNGTHLRARYDGRPRGLLAAKPRLTVQLATVGGWQTIS